MHIIFIICMSLTTGILLGFLGGGIKTLFRRKPYPLKKIESTQKLIKCVAGIIKYLTFMCLILGLIWCVYFLILGITTPGQADYANNMAELIVAVLTIVSILFAFIEFLRQKDEKTAKTSDTP
ncbi:MAG: transporter [Blautia sp.]|jgi:hypothetical protein